MDAPIRDPSFDPARPPGLSMKATIAALLPATAPAAHAGPRVDTARGRAADGHRAGGGGATDEPRCVAHRRRCAAARGDGFEPVDLRPWGRPASRQEAAAGASALL